ncbi:cleavage and polyadenylation specificity factor subunit 6 isoform X1 [Danio aesculapii]|uniref:cleavage and polyadenylation specificity factor subunit 6 isoform X1 n=1 Tax=Danio aesculapii TaxID=1142201 RepID=UPI0024BF5C30|nr:cleavage and polyadenylation specificity factor subunit 6 isoform X1 [Danio aesculapii]
MADGVDHIDIYADVEEEFNQESDYPVHDQIDLYDDVISPSANNGDAPEDRDYLDSLPAPGGNEGSKGAPANVVYTYNGKRIALYIGNLTWWTTDEDLTDAIRSIGINDVLEIKFFENRANGQSKGFALVCVGSDSSSRKLMDLLSKRELHGQNPIVTPCNKQSLSQFEMQSRKSERRGFDNSHYHKGTQSGQMSGEGKAGPPGSGSRGGGFPPGKGQRRFPGPPGQGDRFPGPVGPGGPPPHFPGMQGLPRLPSGPPGPLGPPGPPPPGQGLPPPLSGPPNRGDRPPPPVMFPGQFGQPPMGPMPPGPPPPGYGPPPGPPPPQQGPPPPGPFPPRPPGPLGPPLGLAPPPHMQGPPPGGPPPAPHVNPAFFPPPGNNMPSSDGRGPPPGDPYGRPPPYDRDFPGGRDMDASRTPLSEAEFEEIMNRNRAISSSAISRAVSDASAADYGSAIETLVTAISLIKQSKVSADDRCKVLISSLQDCLHGIESKSYGSVAGAMADLNQGCNGFYRRERSRERDHSRSREKSRRHKSRSRDRHEDYYRERSRERDRHRERDRDRERDREREREYRHR